MSLIPDVGGPDPMAKQTTKDLMTGGSTPFTSMDQTNYSAHAAAPEQQYQMDQTAWSDIRNNGAPMYGRSVTGYRDEANRASDVGAQRAAAFGAQGDRNANIMYGLGDKQGANQQGFNQNAGQDYGFSTADRAGALGGLGRLQQFYQQGPGPSAAEAQMRAGADANMAQSMAIAHSGRGVGNNAAAVRQAQFGNAAAGQQLNQQVGVLRAKEASDWRGQQLQGMGLEQQGYGALRGQDIGSMGVNANTGLGYGQLQGDLYGRGQAGQLGYGALASQQFQGGEQQRGNIFGGQLQSDTARYGADKGVSVGMRQADQTDKATDYAMLGAGIAALSDVRAKKDIQPANMAAVFGNAATQGAAQGATDLRPAQGYQYSYKDPGAPGAASGPQVGPMAQDLEKTPAGASTVKTGPDGKKSIDTARLSLVNAAATSELQRRTDELEALLNQRARYAPGEQLPGPTQPASNIGFHQSGATGVEAMQQGPYGLPTQEQADNPAFQQRRAFGR